MAVNDIINQYAKMADFGGFGDSLMKGIDLGSQLATRQADLDMKRQQLESNKQNQKLEQIRYFFDKAQAGSQIKDTKLKREYFKTLYANSEKFGIALTDDWKAMFESNEEVPAGFREAFLKRLNDPATRSTPSGKLILTEMFAKLTGQPYVDAAPQVQDLLDHEEKMANTLALTGQSVEKNKISSALKEANEILSKPSMKLLGDREGYVRSILSNPNLLNSAEGVVQVYKALDEAKAAESLYLKMSDDEKSNLNKEKLKAVQERTKLAKSAVNQRMGIANARLYTQAVNQISNGTTVKKYKEVLSQASADLSILESKGRPTAFEGKEVITNLSRLFAGGVGVVPESRRKEFGAFFSTYAQEAEKLIFSKIGGDPNKVLMTPAQVKLLSRVTKKYISRYEQLFDSEVKSQVDARIRSGAIPKSDRDSLLNDITGGRHARKIQVLNKLKSEREDAIKFLMSNKSRPMTKEQAEKIVDQKIRELGGQ